MDLRFNFTIELINLANACNENIHNETEFQSKWTV